jgi:aspartyl protease family protein
MGLFLVLAVIIAAALAYFSQDQFIAGVEAGEVYANFAFALVAVVLLASLIPHYRNRLPAALRDLMLWVAIVLVICVAYAYRDLLEPVRARVMGELQPGRSQSAQTGVVEVVRRRDGHFVLDGSTAGTQLSFLFDTGASSVVLTEEDAQRIGINLRELNFDTLVSTANGTTRTAPVTLETLTIGSITLRQVRALVARRGSLNTNLLGHTFLDRLESYSVRGDRLTLRALPQ